MKVAALGINPLSTDCCKNVSSLASRLEEIPTDSGFALTKNMRLVSPSCSFLDVQEKRKGKTKSNGRKDFVFIIFNLIFVGIKSF